MPKKTFKFPVWPASGGLDQTSIPGTAQPNTLNDCDNIIFAVNGSRKKRWGLDTFYRSGIGPTVTSNFRGGIDFWRNNSGVQNRKLVAFCGGRLFADSNAGVFSDVTGSTSLTAADRVTFDVFIGLLIAGFENAVPQKYTQTGTFVDLAGSPPNGCYVRVHGGRLWVSGVKTAPHRLYFSAIDNPEDWTLGGGAGSINIDQGDSDPVGITAIFPSYNGDLYVAKRRSLYRIQTVYSQDLATQGFRLQPVGKGIGCIEHNSVVATPNDIFWASERGIHSLIATDKYGDVDAAFVSYPIHELYNENVNFRRSKNMWGVYSPEMNSYLLAYTKQGDSTNGEIIGYNVVTQQLYRWQNIDCAAFISYVDSLSKTRLLLGSESPVNIGVFNTEIVTDYGHGIDLYFTTPIIYPVGPAVTCNFKYLWVFFKPQNDGDFTVTYQIDGKAAITTTVDMSGTGSAIIGTAIIGQSVIGGTGVIKKVAVPLKGEGSGIQFTFGQTDDNDCDIYGYVIEGEYVEDSALPSVA